MSLANSLRTLQAYIQAVGTQLGAGLASAIRHVVVWLNYMMQYVLKAASAFKVFMETIFGKYKGGASGIAMEGLGDAVEDVDSLADGAGSAASGLGDASDAAKQLKKDLSVLPFDELNQLNKDRESTSSGSGSGGVGGGGAGGGLIDGLLDWDNMLDESPLGKLPDWLSRWAKAIKDAIKAEDFYRAGQIIAEGLNKGIDKLYEILDPEKAKEKIYPFIDAITTVFNSLVGNLKWEKLGRVIGRGINIVVGSLNRIIEGINWQSLGTQLARAAYGLIDEINFEEVGNLIGNKIMVIWNILNGFVHNFPWDKLGVKIGDLINGLFEKVDFAVIADTLATGLNGLFDALRNTAETIHWGDIADNISNGIITFIDEFEWEENAESIRIFLTNLCDAIVRAVDNVPDEKWEELGQGIADMLAAAPWEKILKTVGHVIVTVLGNILKGLLKNPEGAFAAAVIAGLSLLKFKDSAFGSLAGNIVKIIIGKSFTDKLTEGFKKALSESVGKAAGDKAITEAGKTVGNTMWAGIKEGLSAFLPVAGIAALIAGGTTLGIVGIAKLAKKEEAWHGGNGEFTGMGTELQDLLTYLSHTKQLTEEQYQALFQLKENMESTGASTTEMAANFVQKYIDMGGSVTDLEGYIGDLQFTAQGERDTFKDLQWAVENAGTQHDLLGQSVDTADEKVKTFSSDVNTSFGGMGSSVEGATNIVKTALQGQIDKMKETVSGYAGMDTASGGFKTNTETNFGSAGTSVENFNKGAATSLLAARTAFKETGDATSDLKSSTDTNLGTSGSLVGTFMEKIKTMATNSIAQYGNLNKSAITHLQGVDKQTQNTIKETDKMSPSMEKSANGAASVFGKSINTIVDHVIAMGVKMARAMSDISASVSKQGQQAGEGYASGMTAGLNQVELAVQNLRNVLSSGLNFNLYAEGQQAGQTFANGLSSVYIPTPHMYVASYTTVTNSDGSWYSYPNWGVSWYRAGGLFKGGNGTMIGIAEDGRDEAVLPLEDRRAMARIGSAIADAGGTSGVTDETIDKLAGAIAEIVMNSQSNTEMPMVYSELKVDDEVLARAVTRGQQKLDYRNNPTPQMT